MVTIWRELIERCPDCGHHLYYAWIVPPTDPFHDEDEAIATKLKQRFNPNCETGRMQHE